MKNKIKSILLILLLLCLLIFLPGVVYFTSSNMNKGIMPIRGNSMTPSIQNGQIAYVQEPQFERGEIVVVTIPYVEDYFSVEGVSMIKRIVGLPGEKIELTTDGVLINGELLNEPYVEPEDIKNTLSDKNTVKECILSDREYYLIGDNRLESFDSRNLGAISSGNFLYGITLEPNNHTRNVIIKWIITYVIYFIIIMATTVGIVKGKKKKVSISKNRKKQK